MLYSYMPQLAGDRDEYTQFSYSQFGEDVVVWAWIETLGLAKPGGFFVDVGAHHPRRGSNTYLLRKILGWKGINIEPDPALFAVFEAEAPECINLKMAVGSEHGEARLTIYNHPSANTISDRLRERQEQNAAMEVVGEVIVPVRPLTEILDEHLPRDASFHFLSVDAEGLDFEVITSLDLEKYRPDLILVEDFDFDVNAPSSPIYKALTSHGYSAQSHAMVSTLYRRIR